MATIIRMIYIAMESFDFFSSDIFFIIYYQYQHHLYKYILLYSKFIFQYFFQTLTFLYMACLVSFTKQKFILVLIFYKLIVFFFFLLFFRIFFGQFIPFLIFCSFSSFERFLWDIKALWLTKTKLNKTYI